MKHYLGSCQCNCGKIHNASVDEIIIGKGVIEQLPELVSQYGAKRPFLLCDRNSFQAAGERICAILKANDIPFSKYVFCQENLEPNEWAVGSAVMHFDSSCDLIIGIGSGVINDLGKILSHVSGRKYFIVGTATSMDGYASSTSSVAIDGLKVSLDSCCANVIIGDTDILKTAPDHMLKAGLGDMLAKYVSIAEWRISHIITGEYYCERIAQLIRNALKKCVDNAEGLLKRQDEAIEAVFEGLAISGIAMAYAGMSRPAAGVEHYFSHVWDMRGLEFGTQVDLHGIQCAVATLKTVKLYEIIKKLTPDKLTATEYVNNFSFDAWQMELRNFLGKSAEPMIAAETRDQKYNKNSHGDRFDRIKNNWNEIVQIIDEELPSYQDLAELMDSVGINKEFSSLGVDESVAKMTFKATKDIRDKYVLSRFAWDLGVLDYLCEQV